MKKNEILKLLGVPDKEQRLYNLELLLSREPTPTPRPEYSNNHIHTTYSFSPYSPSAAVWFARDARLLAAGIMNPTASAARTNSGARRAGGVGTTCGIEFRITLAYPLSIR